LQGAINILDVFTLSFTNTLTIPKRNPVKTKHIPPLFLSLLLIPLSTLAQLEVSSFFGDHMVLQRDQPLPVWGKAAPDEEVNVTFRDASATAITNEAGEWLVKLPPVDLGEPASLQIKSGNETVVFDDVLVGEVWICSGQSNMDWSVLKSDDAEAEIAAANYPSIRLFDIPRRYSPDPLDDVEGEWQICSPESVAPFSAVGYYFGRELWQDLEVPIGLISIAWGGTRAEAWTPFQKLNSNPAYQQIVAEYYTTTDRIQSNPNLEATMQADFDRFNEQIDALSQNPPSPEASWFDPKASFVDLVSVQPGEDFLEDTNGLVHVRNVFTLDEKEAQRQGARIRLGQIDNYDVTWINGVPVGSTGPEVENARQTFREYKIPDGILRAGENVIVLQIVDVRRIVHFGHNIDKPEIFWPHSKPFALSNGWEMKLISDIGRRPSILANEVNDIGSYLWNGMVAPIVPAAFRGVIWYQGESNAFRADQYRTLFPDMIEAWRTAWGRGPFPFYFVQLANFSDREGWPELREAQRETLSLPNTGMAVTIDIGDPDNIHPTNKQDVGKRLSLWALAKTYGSKQANGEPIPYSGPLLEETLIGEGEIKLRFDHSNGGLLTSDGGELTGFTIAEEDGDFLPAQARIQGREIIVSHPEMNSPQDVRYAWAINPDANLINGARLPASPFRTDQRPFTTEM